MPAELVTVVSSSSRVRDAVGEAVARLGLRVRELGMSASPTQILDQTRVAVIDVNHIALAQLAPLLDAMVPGGREDDVMIIHLGDGQQFPRIQLLRYARAHVIGSATSLLAACVTASPLEDPTGRLLGQSPALALIRDQVRSVSRFRDVSVLILGESGTGKELVARAIHELSAEVDAPFVAINCSAVSSSLFESELFGHEAGSFTGAKGEKHGLFEAAAGGTLLLDEIGEMPTEMQAKLLRTLETREFLRVGGTKPQRLTARVISATHRGSRGDAGTLRLDLHFRLAGFTITLPALSRRSEDIIPLARHYVALFCRRHEIAPVVLTSEAEALLLQQPWPGNVRELRAIVENAVILSKGSELTRAHIEAALARPSPYRRSVVPPSGPEPSRSGAPRAVEGNPGTLREVERDLIACAFQDAGGNLSEAARTLGIPRTTLRDKLKRYGLLDEK